LKKKRKKREVEKRKKGKEGRVKFVINYHTPFHEPNNSTFILDRESSDMVLIIKRNIFFKWL